jgi:hypothetical protein
MAAAATPKRTSDRTGDAARDSLGHVERRRGLAPVAAAAARVAAPLLKKRGLAEARIVTEWRAIAGDLVSERSAPERLVRARQGDGSGGGTLRLRVAGAWALEFQHIAPELIARINAYFGYPAVARLQLVQAPLPAARRAPQRPVPLPAAIETSIADRAAKIADPELRDRVIALGRALEQRARRIAKARMQAPKPV